MSAGGAVWIVFGAGLPGATSTFRARAAAASVAPDFTNAPCSS